MSTLFFYAEGPCTITHEGEVVTAEGTYIDRHRIVAYLGKDNMLTDWHGEQIGTYHITHTWPTPGSPVSETMSQVEANVDGMVFIGRSAGVGMIFRGKRKVLQHRWIPFGRDCLGNISGYCVVSGSNPADFRVHAQFVGNIYERGSMAQAREAAIAKCAELNDYTHV